MLLFKFVCCPGVVLAEKSLDQSIAPKVKTYEDSVIGNVLRNPGNSVLVLSRYPYV